MSLVRVHCITSLFLKQVMEVVPNPVTFLYEVAFNIKTQVLVVRCYNCLFIDVVFSMPRNSGKKNCNKILEYIIYFCLFLHAHQLSYQENVHADYL